MPETKKQKTGDQPTHETWKLGKHQVDVTSLDRVLWPDDNLTKRDMVEYYHAIAPTILPYLKNRPLTFNVHPEGIDESGFYRRKKPSNAPDWLGSVSYEPETRSGELVAPVIENAAGLIWYANQGSLEFHIWLSSSENLECPTWAALDLDPGDEAAFEDVLEAAMVLRDVLSEDGLVAYPKTSGGRGVHLFIPIKPQYSFDDVRGWIHRMAERAASNHPDLLAEASGSTHTGRVVTLDHAQNSIARNTVAPYSLRAKAGAPVSAPVSWEEIEKGEIRPNHFTIHTIFARLDQIGDLWSKARKNPQELPIQSD